jgi:hypothetical protein
MHLIGSDNVGFFAWWSENYLYNNLPIISNKAYTTVVAGRSTTLVPVTYCTFTRGVQDTILSAAVPLPQ